MSSAELEREYVISLLKCSLIRVCGGGITATAATSPSPSHVTAITPLHNDRVVNREGGNDRLSKLSSVTMESGTTLKTELGSVSSPRNSIWREKLGSLALKSISYPNGTRNGGITCSNNGKQRKKKCKNSNYSSNFESNDNDSIGGKGHDIEIRIALSLFHQYCHKKENGLKNKSKKLRQKRRRQSKEAMVNDKDIQSANNRRAEIEEKKMEITTAIENINEATEIKYNNRSSSIDIKSDLGLVRTIYSPKELSTLLVNDMEDQLWYQRTATETKEGSISSLKNNNDTKNMIMMIQSNHAGIICIVTNRRFKYLRKHDRYPCSHCTKWCKGQKGLWWHEQMVHGLDHSMATTVAASSSSSSSNTMAIIPYNQNGISAIDNCSITINTNQEKKNIEKTTKDEQEPFIVAIKNGNYDEFLQKSQLPEHNPKLYLDRNGASALHWASGCGQLSMVKYLIEQCHCSPNQVQKGKRSFNGRTPLHWSARNGHLNVVIYLVEECQIKIDAKTIDGTTAFCWASWQGHLEIMQ